MRLRALRLRGVGRFRDGVAVEGMSGGLDVLVAPNEAGKSTLFRAVETLFGEKFDTTSQKVLEPLLSDGSGTALIEADVEMAGDVWRIAKSFGQQRRAQLTGLGGSGARFTGQDAEAEFARLAGLNRGKPGALGFLWVGQGAGLEPLPPDPKQGGAEALKEVVEREVAALTGTGRLRLLRAAVRSELSGLATASKGGPKTGGPWETAIVRRDALKADLERAVADREAGTRRLKAIASLARRRDELAAADGIAAAQQRLALAEARLAEEEVAKGRHEKALANRKLAERDEKDAAAKLDTLLALQRRHGDLSAAIARLDEQYMKAQTALATAQDNEREANAQAAGAADALAAALRALASVKFVAIRQRVSDLTTLQAQIAALESEFAERAVSATALDVLVDAEATMVRAHDRMTSAAPRIEIEYEPGSEGAILADGRPLPAGPVVTDGGKPIRLSIPGIGAIVVSGGAASGLEALRAAHQKAADTFEARRRALGVATVAEARERQARGTEIERLLAGARSRRAGLAPDGELALTRECERLRLLAGDAKADGQAIADPAASERLVEAARGRLDEVTRAARTAAAAAAEQKTARAALDGQLAASRAQFDRAAAELAARAGEAGLEAALADAQGLLAAARDRMNSVTREEVALREVVGRNGDLTHLGRARDAARVECDRLMQEAQSLNVSLARLEGEEAQSEGDAAADVARLEAELRAAQAAVSAFETEVAGLRLLTTVIDEAEAAARDRYLDPVLSRIEPYLEAVIPGSRLELSADLGVTGLLRSTQDGHRPVKHLSGGTREQIAVLVRLAYARVLADAGRATPVILDDALVYADDGRLGAMFAALAQAAAHHQVLVLSCRHRAFEGLGGTRLAMTPWPAAA
jgi:DNA repair exonuclease SbcCD ATPase subunit